MPAPASVPRDTLAPTSASVPSPPLSSFPLIHLIYKIQSYLPHSHIRITYQVRNQSIRTRLPQFPFTLKSLTLPLPRRFNAAANTFRRFSQTITAQFFDNPPRALQHGYRSGPADGPKFSSGISSPSKARRPSRPGGLSARTGCRPLPHRPTNHKGRDTHNPRNISCSVKAEKVVLKTFLDQSGLQKVSVFGTWPDR